MFFLIFFWKPHGGCNRGTPFCAHPFGTFIPSSSKVLGDQKPLTTWHSPSYVWGTAGSSMGGWRSGEATLGILEMSIYTVHGDSNRDDNEIDWDIYVISDTYP